MTGLLPPNASALERAADAVIQARIGALPVPLRDLWSAQDCPVALLPWLAWSLSIDQWDAAWPEHVQRARIASAIAVQRIKGTRQSVADVIASFGGNVVLREWWQKTPRGVPHTFDLTVALAGDQGQAPTAEFITSVITEVARTKPARSHFTFSVAVNFAGGLGLRGVARPMIYARLDLFASAAPPNPFRLDFSDPLNSQYLALLAAGAAAAPALDFSNPVNSQYAALIF